MSASQPSPLNPWFIVQRHMPAGTQFYRSPDSGEDIFTHVKGLAMLFMSLPSAVRIADAEGAEIRVLANKEHAAEFGR